MLDYLIKIDFIFYKIHLIRFIYVYKQNIYCIRYNGYFFNYALSIRFCWKILFVYKTILRNFKLN